METSYLVVFSIAGGALFLLVAVVYIVLWARLNGLEELEANRYMELTEKAEPKEITRALAVSESSAARMDAAALGLEKFKEQIHREMQRFYAIMRRTENSATLAGNPKQEEEDVPAEIDPSELQKPSESPNTGRKTKAELREIARAKGISI